MRAAPVLGLLVTLPCSAAAQTPASDFLALDPTGGFQTRAYSKVEEGETPDPLGTYKGWNVGVTIRPIRTFGVAGEIGRTSNGERSLQHYLVGGRVTSPLYGEFGYRVFAHALAGLSRAHHPTGPTQNGSEFVAGAGFDLLAIFRLQFDYMRLKLLEVPKNQVRVVVGGVLPLCFRGCGPNDVDGLNLSKR